MASQRQASSASQTPLISPAELAYLYTSLALPNSPIRPDGRSPTQFRPLTAETDILPGTNGSARVGFADGTQAIVGVKAEVEKTALSPDAVNLSQQAQTTDAGGEDGKPAATGGHGSWVQMSIEIPGFRDDDALPVFLSEMMREPLVESVSSGHSEDAEMAGGLKGRLVINRRWHWRLYIDLPKLKSKGEEDPFFDDDWDAAEYLYPRTRSRLPQKIRPPVTLLVISVGDNIIFDPNREEITVADTVMAISVTRDSESDGLKLLSIRTVDPPSRLTQPGVPNSENVATGGSAGATEGSLIVNPATSEEDTPGVWRPRRGGVKRKTVARMIKLVLEKGGVGEEVLEGLENVEVG
ncbi:putative exoribonuclease family protein, partial [Aspergillus steynii IBT 23096]